MQSDTLEKRYAIKFCFKLGKNVTETYETIEEMKEAVTKVIDTLTQEDFNGAFQKLLEYINKSAHTKKVWKLIVCTSYISISEKFCSFLEKKEKMHSLMENKVAMF